MVAREDLKPWVLDALRLHGGKAGVVEIAKYVWDKYEADLRKSGDCFYKWQYEMRWAGDQLVRERKIEKLGKTGVWQLI
jgi:hypothetical protein